MYIQYFILIKKKRTITKSALTVSSLRIFPSRCFAAALLCVSTAAWYALLISPEIKIKENKDFDPK